MEKSIVTPSCRTAASDTVIKLDLHQAIVDAIIQSDGDAAFKACQALLRSPDK